MDIEQMKKDLGGGNVFPIGEENVAFAKYFTGECYLNMLTTERVPVGLVTFAPKTINAYHVHHKGGQILMVTGGRGWYQEEGKPARELKAGDVVNIPPEVKHWHGAAKDSWFQHLAVEVPAEGASNEVLFGENWNNEDIDLKTRSIITVVALMAQGITDSSLKFHLQNAKDHGVTQKEIAAIITHIAFYAGWPKGWAVFNLAKEVWNEEEIEK